MTDADLLALNVYEEAAGEPPDGRAAVARVVKNRMAKKFFSDGTIIGTTLARDQFSWAWFEMINGHYTRVCDTEPEAVARAEMLLSRVNRAVFAQCGEVARAVMAGTYSGPAYDQLTDEAVLYLNPAIVSHMPAWTVPEKLICQIGRHDFYAA